MSFNIHDKFFQRSGVEGMTNIGRLMRLQTDYMAGFMADAQANIAVDMSGLGITAVDKAALGTKTAGKAALGSNFADQSAKLGSKAAEVVGRGLLRDASEDAPILPHPCLHAGYDQDVSAHCVRR